MAAASSPVPAIDGIELVVEFRANSGSVGADVELSWNGGAGYTSSGKGFTTTSQSDVTQTLGSSSDTWGRTWSDSELNNTNFRVRANKTGTGNPVEVDHIQVKIFYTAPVCPGGVVSTTVDSATGGSLRACIIWANGNPGADDARPKRPACRGSFRGMGGAGYTSSGKGFTTTSQSDVTQTLGSSSG